MGLAKLIELRAEDWPAKKPKATTRTRSTVSALPLMAPIAAARSLRASFASVPCVCFRPVTFAWPLPVPGLPLFIGHIQPWGRNDSFLPSILLPYLAARCSLLVLLCSCELWTLDNVHTFGQGPYSSLSLSCSPITDLSLIQSSIRCRLIVLFYSSCDRESLTNTDHRTKNCVYIIIFLVW